MAGKKGTTKQRDSGNKVTDLGEQLEHAFLAGLGAWSNAQKAGAKTFDSLVKQGEDFRKKTTKKSESLIDDVQEAIREMTDDAQSKATGLLDQVRDKSQLKKLYSVFDTRVAGAMDRLNVPSKNDIDAINKKLNKIIKLLDDKPASKKASTATKRKTTKSVARTSTKKTSTKKAPAKTTSKPAAKSTAKAA